MIYFRIKADTEEADKKIDETKKKARSLSNDFADGAAKVAKWGAAVVAAAAIAATAMSVASAKAVEGNSELIKQSQEYSRQTEQSLAIARRFNAELSTVDVKNINNATAAVGDVGDMFKSAAANLTAEFAPAITYGAELIVEFGNELNEMGLTSEAVFAAFKTALRGIATAFETIGNVAEVVFHGVQAAMALVADAAISMAMTIIDALDNIPGVNFSEVRKSLEGALVEVRTWGSNSANAVLEAFDDSGEAAAAVDSFFANAERRAHESSARITKAQADAINTHLNALRESIKTEDELAAEKLDRDLYMMQAAFENKLLLETEYQELRAGVLAKYSAEEAARAQETADKIAAIEKEKADRQSAILGGALSGLTSLMNTRSKEMFEIGKGAAYAQATVSTYTGMTKALELGWPLGPIAATAIAAAGWANVRAIKGTSYQKGGGGGGGGTGGGSASLPPTGDLNQQMAPVVQRNISVSVAGEHMYSSNQVRGLMSAISEELGDNVSLGVV